MIFEPKLTTNTSHDTITTQMNSNKQMQPLQHAYPCSACNLNTMLSGLGVLAETVHVPLSFTGKAARLGSNGRKVLAISKQRKKEKSKNEDVNCTGN